MVFILILTFLFCYLKFYLFRCETLTSPLPLTETDIELNQTQGGAVTDNGVTDGDTTSIKDAEVDTLTKEENPIFSDETTPSTFPKAAIGGSSQGNLNFPNLPAVLVAKEGDDPDSTSPTVLPPPLEKEETTRV